MPDSPFVGLYLRKSRDKAELADPDLLHKHRREGLRWAAARDLTVPPEHIFEEVGSGERLRSRPVCRGMLEMIDRLPRGAGGYVWTTEVSRLTRGSLSDRATIYECLLRPAVIHCTRAGDFDLKNPHQRMNWETATVAASYELGVFKERVEGARVEMIMEGKILTGKPPFGWWWDRNAKNEDGSRGAVRVDPARFPVMQAICADALHLSTYALAKKYGKGQGTIHNLLRNPFICGQPARRHFPHNGERYRRDNGEPWKYGSHKVDPSDWMHSEQPGEYEPACTPEEFAAIQAALEERRLYRSPLSELNGWCRRVVRWVGHEDARARLSAKHSGTKSVPTYELLGPRGPHILYIPRAKVHDAVGQRIRQRLGDPDWLRLVADKYKQEYRPPQARPQSADLQAEVQTLERRIDTLLDREMDAAERRDSEDLASIKRQRGDYKKRLATAKAAILAIGTPQDFDQSTDALMKELQAHEDKILAWWDSEHCTDPMRAAVVEGMIEAVTCRVERDPGRWAWYREVEEVRWKWPFSGWSR